MKLKKRLLSVLLVLAVMVTFMPTVTLTANAASKKTSNKVYTVKSEKNERGDSTKYTYNKKGFVTKKVTKYTKKGSDKDSVRTVTTTYVYNKKNKIKTKTTKDVDKVTTYKINKTTGKATSQSLGTVTTTTTDVTKFTYKSGRATKAVTTSTTVKSGSIKETDVRVELGEELQLSDGRYVAGFNDTNPDGTDIEDKTSDNAYYYTGNIGAAVSTGTRTTSYRDNGDGTYTETENYVSNDSNYTTNPKRTYYRWDSESGKYVTGTEDEHDFFITDSVEVVVGGSTGDSVNETTTQVISDNDVTKETYKYDKKKRVKQTNKTITNNYAYTKTYSETRKYNNDATDWDEDEETGEGKRIDGTTTGTRTSTYTSGGSSTETSSQVEKYTYDKNNRLTKKVVTDNGVRTRTEVEENARTNSRDESTTKWADGKTTSSNESTTFAGENNTVTTVYANGKRTVTTTKLPYKCTEVSSSTSRNGSSRSNEETSEYTFYKNGGSMTVTNSKENYKSDDGSSDVEVSSETRYEYDKNGSEYSRTTSYNDTYTNASGEKSVYSGKRSNYEDGDDSTEEKCYYSEYSGEVEIGGPEDTEAAAIKATVDSKNRALAAAGTPYVETKSKAVKSEPSKVTTKYTYDKNGNLKKVKTTGSSTETVDLRNETYGNTIFQFGSDKMLEAVQTSVSHSYKDNRYKDNTVKDGSNRIKSAMAVGLYASDRSTPEYYGVDGHITYTLKSKTIAKKSVREAVELQQWLIQNPGCGSAAGVF